MLEFAKNGVCPKCGSENVKYYSSVVDSEGLYYECECEDCNTTFKECYDLTFTGHASIVSDNEEIEFLSK